jgi:hypothetical protein
MKVEIFKKSYTIYDTKYFLDHNSINMAELYYTLGVGVFTGVAGSRVNTEEEYVKNYGNKLTSVHRMNFMVILERDGPKLSLKVFFGQRGRRVGVSWFKISTNCHFLTLNTDTGDVYSGSILDYHKKTKVKKKLKRNYLIGSPIRQIKHRMVQFNPIENTEIKIQLFNEVMELFFNELGYEGDSKLSNDDKLLLYFFKKKGIKYPNNYKLFYDGELSNITKKVLIKNDMKIVDAFMSMNGFSGDAIRKAIHSCKKTINPKVLSVILEIFPKEWILQDDELLVKSLDTPMSFMGQVKDELKMMSSYMGREELRKVFKCHRLLITEHDINQMSLHDHVEMYLFLKAVGEDIKWKSEDTLQFREEHMDWSDKCAFYKRGKYTRTYADTLYQIVTNVISFEDENYYPVVLTTSDEYNSESNTQQNCVKGYVGRPSSIIVSLRRGSIDSEERATVEYQVFKKNEKIDFNRPQSLGRFNTRLDETWTPILHLLDQRFTQWVNIKDDTKTVKIEKVLANGQKLHSDSEWSENGFLNWTYSLINNVGSSYRYDFNLDF